MREVNIGSKKYTKVLCLDNPGIGGACHRYIVEPVTDTDIDSSCCRRDDYCYVNFQKGPIKENGVNGCHNEDLLAIVIDRLEHFQSGDFACNENAMALVKLEEALMWLKKRSQGRIDRGVEGTSIK